MSLLCYAIALPFAAQDYSSIPLSIGVLSGLMWLPISWIIEHKVGTFHALTRTILITIAWVLWPEHRFTLIPCIIVFIYAVSIYMLYIRWYQYAKGSVPFIGKIIKIS